MTYVVLFGLLCTAIGLIFNFLPAIPSLNPNVKSSILGYFSTLCDTGGGILGFFIDNWVLVLALTLVIVIYTAEPIYRFIKWVLRHLPFKFTK